MVTRRPTRDERDREIVRKAGPWRAYAFYIEPTGMTPETTDNAYQRTINAASRMLNRIAKEKP